MAQSEMPVATESAQGARARVGEGISGSRDAPPSGVSAPGRARAALQNRASSTVRRHALRTGVRVLVLLGADAATFLLLRDLVRVARTAVFGPDIASAVSRWLPTGYLGGWQFGTALLLSLAVTRNYAPGDRRRDPGSLFLGCALALALALWVPLWSRGFGVVLIQYLVTVLLLWAAVVTERFLVDRAVWAIRVRSRVVPRAVLVGTEADCTLAKSDPIFTSEREYELVDCVFLSPDRPDEVLSSHDELAELIDRERIETVVVCGNVPDDVFAATVDMCLAGGCEVLSFSRSFEMAGIRPEVVRRNQRPFVQLTRPEFKAHQLFVKRVLDLTLGMTMLLVLSPLMAAAALAIKLTSPGPVFFRQWRVGLGGHRFRIWKFRSMYSDAEARLSQLERASMYEDKRLFKVRNDPRVTKVGAFLRRTSLDELPQLFNVLRGEMSLVGPRPPTPNEVDLYEEAHYCRFDVKPGMTGPWQVGGRNTLTDFEAVVRLEREYIRDWSLLNDFKILCKTVPAVLGMRGAH